MTENRETGHTPVTVLGLGMMGQALAGAFLRDGYPTTMESIKQHPCPDLHKHL